MGIFGGTQRPPTDVVNKFSDTATSIVFLTSIQKQINQADVAADTYNEILNVAGPGVVKSLAFKTLNATSRTMTLKVEIDGVNVYEQVTDTIAANNTGGIVFGSLSVDTNWYLQDTGNAHFNSSLVINLKTSTDDAADETAILVSYYLT